MRKSCTSMSFCIPLLKPYLNMNYLGITSSKADLKVPFYVLPETRKLYILSPVFYDSFSGVFSHFSLCRIRRTISSTVGKTRVPLCEQTLRRFHL
uniref:Ovule protein n=1 Tax=Parascaris univalens TaxID=6257 RepID=A0A914ZYI4_PARUN